MTDRENVSIEQIDQLRAGLLDNTPQLKAQVEATLHEDQNFAAEHNRWEQILQQLESAEANDIGLKNQLRLRRRSVLSGKAEKMSLRFTLPQMVLAAATSVALTLSVVLWFTDQPQTAIVMETSDDSTQTIVYRAPPDTTGEFDLTNNVDFYVWMERQNDLSMEVPRNGT